MQGVRMRGTAALAVAGAAICLIVGLIGGAGGASAAIGSTDLSMTKTDTADPVTVGDTFAYVLTVKNLGANDAGDVMTTDTLPSQVSYVSATPSTGTCQKAGSTITCDLGQVNAGATASVTITVKAARSGTASNSATLTSSDDTNATNNIDSETTVINKKPSTPKPKKHKGRPSCATPTIVGTAGDDVLQGTSHSDVIVSFTGNDQVFAGGGNDLICTDGGADFVDGGPGRDFVNGGSGPDRLFGSDGGDTLKGKNGRDKLLGGKGDDLLNGGKKRDKCKGGPGRDFLVRCP